MRDDSRRNLGAAAAADFARSSADISVFLEVLAAIAWSQPASGLGREPAPRTSASASLAIRA